MSVFVYGVRLANEGCQNKVWGMRLQLFTKENTQMKEKDGVERDRKEENVRTTERRDSEWNPWEQKYSC